VTFAFSTGQTNPKVGCTVNDSENDEVGDALLPNHELFTGAFTFLPVRPPLSILSTSTPRYASAVYRLVAADDTGKRSAPERARFTIVR
jgi:hypothetical protein